MKRTVVHFHVGRGGRFNNPGYKTFVGVEDMHPSESSIVFEQDEDGKPLPDKDWVLVDGGGSELMRGKANILARTGRLDYDGEYNTDIFKYIEDCNDEEVELIKTAIIKEDVSSFRLTDDDKDYILNF